MPRKAKIEPREISRFDSLEELVARRENLADRIQALDSAFDGQFDEENRASWNSLNEELDALDATIAERATRLERIGELARAERPGQVELGADPGPAYNPGTRDRGLWAMERYRNMLAPEAGDRLDELLRERDPLGLGAKYIHAVASPAYLSAFSKMVKDPVTGHLRFTAEAVESVRRVSAVEAERAMSVGTGSAGGFAVPFQLDPSIMISGTGALNPLRQISRVEVTVEGTWKGVSADQVTAAYQAEASEVADASPTLVQPTITAQRGTAFVPFSIIEVQQDYATLLAELGRLLSDARDVLDATKMLTGTGTNEPGGILNIGGTGGLTTTQRVQTAVAATFAVGDPWLLKAGLAPRFINNTSVVAAPGIFDVVYRFTGGNATEPPIIPTRDGPCFGRPKYELSTMVTTTTTGSKIALAGDFRTGFMICDRLGFNIELVPHLFGATSRFPTGQRGALAIWRTGSGAVVPNALRYLEVR